MYNRQIYCNTEGTMVSKWSDTDLTQCPNNPGHSIVASNTIITAARLASHLKDLFTTTSTSYVTINKFLYQGSDYYANDQVAPKYLKITASVSAGTYDLRLIDVANNVLWSSTGNSNTTDQTITVDFDLLSVPASESILSLQGKSNGPTLTISNVALFSRLVPQ